MVIISAMQKVYLLCGPPGCGKTWVSEQIEKHFSFVVHDEHPIDVYPVALLNAARVSDKPVLGNAPFRASVIIKFLKSRNIEVKAIYIVEPYDTVARRFIEREGREKFSTWHRKNIRHQNLRAETNADFKGTANEVLEYMRGEATA